MKASYNWLKDYLDFDIAPSELGDILTDIGLEVEGLEEKETIKGGLKGVVAGEVLTCGKHPNADRLSLTTVKIGDATEPLQIVCGAPNVAKGQKVWVATVGTTIHLKDDTSFEIKEAKVRGETSKGMICAEDELGLGDDHDGIMVLDDSVKIGQKAADFYQIEKDYVYEIGLTPNRSDAICHLGIADDLLAYFKINNISSGKVNRPEISPLQKDNDDYPIKVEVENSIACPRYTGVSISNINIQDSPEWIQKRLKSIGVKCINNVVDITNFVLHEYGQPLHAFDIAKIQNAQIRVKTLPENTPFITLDEQERKLTENDLMICDDSSSPMCIGGVYGGLGTGVTNSTSAIFLEAAHFNPGWIRRTSTRHLLRTDAAKVFEKGSDPNITKTALLRAASLMKEYAGAKISSELIDIYPKVILPKIIPVSFENVNRLIGVTLSPEKISTITKALNMEIVEQDEKGFSIAIPTNKHDVIREADVIEEILRIYGYNNIPINHKMNTTMSISTHPTLDEFRKLIGDFLANNGFLEMMGLSLVNSNHYEDYLPKPKSQNAVAKLVPVMNTSNINMDVMRPDMVLTALETIQYNQNRQQPDLMLFEMGRSYQMINDAFKEVDHLTLTMSGNARPTSWQEEDQKSSFYTLKSAVHRLLGRIGAGNYKVTPLEDDDFFQFGFSYSKGQKELVKFGKIKSSLSKEFGIRNDVWFADFSLLKIYEVSQKNKMHVTQLSKFPGVTRDLALIVDKNQAYNEIESVAAKAGPKQLKSITLFDIYEDAEQLGENKRSLAIRLEYQDDDKTLTDKELDKFTNKILGALKHHMGATLR